MKNSTVAGVLIGLVFMLMVALTAGYVTRADDTVGSVTASTTADVANATPAADATIRISQTAFGTNDFTTGISPSVGTTTSIHITGRVSDANGEADIATTSVVFYRTGVTNGSACTADNNDCYRVAACSLNTAAGNDTEVDYNCPVDIAYWIDATDASGRFPSDDWTVLVKVSDLLAASSTATRSIDIESLLALNIPGSIAYGTFGLGDETTSGNNQEMVLTQRGNTYVDVELSGTSMGCSILGSIPVGNQKWSLLDVGYSAATGTLSGTPTGAQRNITYRESEVAELTSSLYWNIGIPSTGVKGFCSGLNTVSIVAATSSGGGGNLGETWTLRTAAAAASWKSVTYGNSLFVAVACGAGSGGGCDTSAGTRIMTSPDGITWTARTSPTARQYDDVIYDNGLFVAVAQQCPALSGCVITSSDGITWTARDPASVNAWSGTAYGNGLFVTVAANDVHIPNQQVMTSPDGITWTGRATPANRTWNSIAYGNGTFVAISNSGQGSEGVNRIMTSPDGITWTMRAAPNNTWYDVVYSTDDSQFVAVSSTGSGDRAMTSPDGITWTVRTTPDSNWTGLTYGNGVYVAVADSGDVMTSPDGITWTTQTSAADYFWRDVTYANGRFVAVAYGDPFLVSGTNRVMTSE